jgi:CubicO group peptidase (beta-lactamase class C family)
METIQQFEKSLPEAQGISSIALKTFVDEAEQTLHDLHSFVLLRHGYLIAEGWWKPYEADDPHILFSLSKSFTSTAVGLAIAEGKLRLDDLVISFFPDETPAEVNENLSAMKVRHLLSMSTGHSVAPTAVLYKPSEKTWIQTFLSQPVDYIPGTFFCYNTAATYVLSTIIQKVSGQTLLEYLKPRLFRPLGIEKPIWEVSPQGINTGGFGLSIRTRDIARFGQLFLQKGGYVISRFAVN